MSHIPIALQLYSVREDLEKDPSGTLKAVARMGYQGVEFAGPLRGDPGEWKSMLRDLRLACCGWHTPYAAVQDDRLQSTMDFHQALENPFIIIPSLPEELRRTREGWFEAADFFNRLSEKLGQRGFRTGYHNHHVEFAPLDGESPDAEDPWDALFSRTAAEVIMQLDIGNAVAGGGDVLDILRRYPGRAVTVHIKPYSTEAGRDDMTAGYRPLVGEDDVDWARVFELCETVGGTEWYIVEYESDAYPPLRAVDITLQKLRAMGK